MGKIKGLCFGNGCVCTMFGTFWGSAPTRCHHHCQGTHGNAPALPALMGIMPMFKTNQASMHGAARRLASKASWFKPLPLWGSEQNTNTSQNDHCEMLPRALQLCPSWGKTQKAEMGKEGCKGSVSSSSPHGAAVTYLRGWDTRVHRAACLLKAAQVKCQLLCLRLQSDQNAHCSCTPTRKLLQGTIKNVWATGISKARGKETFCTTSATALGL